MEQRRRRKHAAHRRVLVVCDDHRAFFEATPGGRRTLAKLERAVAVVVERRRRQARYRIEQRAAADRCRKARRTLYRGLAYVARVSMVAARVDEAVGAFQRTSWTTDDDLAARAEAILGAASKHEALLVSEGVLPGHLALLARAVAALKQGKQAVVRARVRFTEATAAIDQALGDADNAVVVLRGILATSPDALGALTALRKAKRIGPRSRGEGHRPSPVLSPASSATRR